MASTTETALATELLAAVDGLLGAYSTVVDSGDWAVWPDLFADECSYSVYSVDDRQRGLPLAYILDDCRERLLDRVKFITEVWSRTVEPYRTRHFVQRTAVVALDDRTFAVNCNFLVAYAEPESTSALLASGSYQDRIVFDGASARFADHQVLLDGIPARYLVYPL